MLKQVLLAGVLLGVMSIVDTLSYAVRTAGVLTKRLAISLALFNILVIFSRTSNLASAPILGNFPDKVNQGVYAAADVLKALRVDLLFIVAGVLVGALITPSVIGAFGRGIKVLEEKGSLPPTVWYALVRFWRIKDYLRLPNFSRLPQYFDFRSLPIGFLIFNIFVTCFYSIGVMSTVLAASWNHALAGTAIMLSGIVNGIATILLFVIVDPPAAVVIDQCIVDKRPTADAKTMNVCLIATRLAGCLLAIGLLPMMAHYVLAAAHWVDTFFGGGGVS
jgi:hypothetical protein